MISIEKLKDYAKKLEFTMEEDEYVTLQSELSVDDALSNAKDKMSNRVKLPKVVE